MHANTPISPTAHRILLSLGFAQGEDGYTHPELPGEVVHVLRLVRLGNRQRIIFRHRSPGAVIEADGCDFLAYHLRGCLLRARHYNEQARKEEGASGT
jgi:hypothetical protein